jgi:hypothetical protein
MYVITLYLWHTIVMWKVLSWRNQEPHAVCEYSWPLARIHNGYLLNVCQIHYHLDNQHAEGNEIWCHLTGTGLNEYWIQLNYLRNRIIIWNFTRCSFYLLIHTTFHYCIKEIVSYFFICCFTNNLHYFFHKKNKTNETSVYSTYVYVNHHRNLHKEMKNISSMGFLNFESELNYVKSEF